LSNKAQKELFNGVFLFEIGLVGGKLCMFIYYFVDIAMPIVALFDIRQFTFLTSIVSL